MKESTKNYLMELLKQDIEVNSDLPELKQALRDLEKVEVEAIKPNHDRQALHKMMDALEGYKKAYNDLREAWEKYDINQTESINYYPYSCSFDEVDVSEWCDNTIKELDEIDYPYVGVFKKDYYFGADVQIYINPRDSYTMALLKIGGENSFKWWIELDIVTYDVNEALKESKKEQYQCQGYSES